MRVPSEPAAQAERGDPRSYDYSAPTRECDVVMKGGITSGVVYPLAICELARVYRLVSIGGTSAGAIAAAAAAAAAEHGRDAGGFAKLVAVPDWLAEDRNLRGLFQPQPATARLFGLVAAVRRRDGLRPLRVARATASDSAAACRPGPHQR